MDAAVLYFFGCRVNAGSFEAAQAAVVAKLATEGLRPVGEPIPRECWPQYGEETLWECYAQCEVVG